MTSKWTALVRLPWRPSAGESPDERHLLTDPEKQEYSDSQSTSLINSTMESGLSRPRSSLFVRCIHLLVWSILGAIAFWAIAALLQSKAKFESHLLTVEIKNGEHEVIHWHHPPEKPAAAFFADSNLDNRWTVSIPNTEQFPLAPQKLKDICSQAHRMHHQLHMEEEHVGHFGYSHTDPDYMQVSDVIASGILPPSRTAGMNSVVQGVANNSLKLDTSENDPITGVCKRSLTFVMHSSDTGFGSTLMALWLAYGLAKFENRAFFIDDRDWVYGSWNTFFAPPPSPSCKPAPETHRVPCPHQADHLLVSSATTRWTFGHGFAEEFENPRKMEVFRQDRIFAMVRQGYEALFHLATEDAGHVLKRVQETKSSVKPGISVGLHVRHGDKHPYTQEHSKSYIPVDNYVNAANEQLFKTFSDSNREDSKRNIAASKMILASDDAAVYNYWEAGDVLRAQDRIILSTPSVPVSSSAESSLALPLPFDGGFFAGRFEEVHGQLSWFGTDPGLSYRALLGRAYAMDLAVLGSMDRTVCTVSSMGCRLLAVMMGWEQAIVQKHWVNVDGDWDWQGVKW